RAEVVRALAASPSAEARRRLEKVLAHLDSLAVPPEQLGPVRAVEVLERAATPEARELLETLARGKPDAVLTREARAALDPPARPAPHPRRDPPRQSERPPALPVCYGSPRGIVRLSKGSRDASAERTLVVQGAPAVLRGRARPAPGGRPGARRVHR